MSTVKLIWSTPHGEDLIAHMARVSSPSSQSDPKNSSRLLKYLIKHNHWSPFEMVNVCMEIETTRDIARQVLRHRSFSFQEFSQRYAEAQGFMLSEVRLQDTENRQNSIEVDDEELQEWWHLQQAETLEAARLVYEQALARGVAKEVARKVLPEGLTMSKMYMNGTLRSWMHYIAIRCGPETQKEHREVALQCQAVLAKVFPNLVSI